MSKKMMLLALAVASVAMFALPAAASAQEIHLEGIAAFNGVGGANSLAAEGEKTITCESLDVSGAVSPGGTTGELSLDFTGCHIDLFGLTGKCRTSGSPLDNTIKSSGVFHLITISSGKPGILLTPVVTTIVCAGISNTITGGNVIGTITRPACGGENSELTMTFAASGNIQEHTLYTGLAYDLTTKTGESGTPKTAGLNSGTTVVSETKGKLNCT